jgi:hypothetical protein
MNDERKNQQIANNLKVLEPLSNTDANGKQIFSRVKERIEAMRIVSIFLKRTRADDQKAQANMELYLDDWIYHNGPIDFLPNKDHPKGGPIFQNALADCVDRITKQQRKRNQQKEHNEWCEMQGALADCEDDDATMGDLPDDADFAKAILKHERSKK